MAKDAGSKKKASKKATKAEKPTKAEKAATTAANTEAASGILANLRKWGVIPAGDIPPVDDDYVQIPDAVKRPFKKVWDTQKAEVLAALDEQIAKENSIQADLGTFAPPRGQAKALRDRLTGAIASDQAAQLLALYSADQKALAGHDVLTYFQKVQRDIERAAEDKPAVLRRYPATMAIKQQQSDAIVEGKAAKAAEDAGESADGEQSPPAPAAPASGTTK